MISFSSDYGNKEENAAYGSQITNDFDSRGFSWIVWGFHPEWGPSMISSWDSFALTDQGKFFSHVMHAKAAFPPAAGKYVQIANSPRRGEAKIAPDEA
jgi:hypothetical protein